MSTKKAATAQLERIKLYQSVFAGPNGKAVLDDLMKNHHILSNTFTGDANQTIFNEGERNVVLRIMSILKLNTNRLQQRIDKHVFENED